MNNREKRLLNTIKSSCYKLRSNGQLPYNLYVCVLALTYESDKFKIMYLRDLCEKYTRVKGYYIRYPESAYDCDKELKEKGYLD